MENRPEVSGPKFEETVLCIHVLKHFEGSEINLRLGQNPILHDMKIRKDQMFSCLSTMMVESVQVILKPCML